MPHARTPIRFSGSGCSLPALVLCVALAVGLVPQAVCQCDGDWTPAGSSGPSIRSYHGLAFDIARGTAVLYGGANGNTLRQDLWEWNGSAWSLISTASAAGARRGMGMTYDSGRSRIVVFGGVTSGGINGQTWEWDGSAWTQHAAGGPAPGARGFFPLVYDEARQQNVLVGGWSGGLTYNNDTWTWNGTDWTLQSPAISPSPRGFHAATYDASRGRVVLFGGLYNTASSSTYYGDTWEWDGTDWHDVTPPTGPAARAYHALAYDSDRQRVVLFGGFEFDHGAFADTWEWDGTDWTQHAPTSAPTLRQNHGMAYDQVRHEIVLFGGQLGSATRNDTWLWSVPLAPAIDIQPDNLIRRPAQTAVFAVQASGSGALGYQWRRDGVDLSDGPTGGGSVISGAASDSLSIANLSPGDTGSYSVAVSNSCDSVLSTAAALLVMTPGDANCDGSIDFFDIDPFVLALFDPAGYAAAYPACDLAAADLDGDGHVDFFDIDPFLACLFNRVCP